MEKYAEGSSDYVTGTGIFLDMVGVSTARAAYDANNAKYAIRGQNLAKQAAVLSKTSMRTTVVGGAIGVVDNSLQAYNDFSNGDNIRGTTQTAQAVLYGAGVVCMFIPGGQLFGVGLITAAGASDLVEYFTEY